jgi:hypothetical protein
MEGVDTLTATILAQRYELTDLLGAGGSGSIYRARSIDTENQLPVAIKPSIFSRFWGIVECLSKYFAENWLMRLN